MVNWYARGKMKNMNNLENVSIKIYLGFWQNSYLAIQLVRSTFTFTGRNFDEKFVKRRAHFKETFIEIVQFKI